MSRLISPNQFITRFKCVISGCCVSDNKTSVAPTGLFNLTGIAVQYSFDTPADNEYRILPRGLFDID